MATAFIDLPYWERVSKAFPPEVYKSQRTKGHDGSKKMRIKS